MSRSGYIDDWDENWRMICWRGAVASAIRGRRGQAFLKEMLAALDALPEKKLISGELQDRAGAVCALGSVGRARGLEMTGIDIEDQEQVAAVFGIPRALACEIMWENDEAAYFTITPEDRFRMVRRWVERNIKT